MLLATTRQTEVLPRTAAKVPVDEMTDSESAELWGLDLSTDSAETAAEVNELRDRCGNWPFLLDVVNSSLLTEVEDGLSVLRWAR